MLSRLGKEAARQGSKWWKSRSSWRLELERSQSKSAGQKHMARDNPEDRELKRMPRTPTLLANKYSRPSLEMLLYMLFSSTRRYKRSDVNISSQTTRPFPPLLTQELSFLLPVSRNHLWESGVGDSHTLKDQLTPVGLLWSVRQGASPATTSGAAATAESLLGHFLLTPTLRLGEVCLAVFFGRVCAGWVAGSERGMTLSPNLCLESVVNLTPVMSLPNPSLC